MKPIYFKIDSDVALADQYADLFDDGDDDDMIAATCDTENNISCAQPRSSTTKIPDDDSDADNYVLRKLYEKSRINKMTVEDDESRGKCCSLIIFSLKLILCLVQSYQTKLHINIERQSTFTPDTNISASTNQQNDLDEVDKILEGESITPSESKPERPVVKVEETINLQGPFQAGSTSTDFSHRFMVGLIRT